MYAIVGDEAPVTRAEAVIAGGAGVVQLRMKRSPAGAVLAAARKIVALARGRALVVLNDRPDLALLAGADGVHLGDEDLPVADARSIVGEGLLVGRTVRCPEAARAALAAGADHVGCGPAFASTTKRLEVAPLGVEALRATCSSVPAPVVAIGGITLREVTPLARAGAAAVAVIADLFGHPDPRARAELLAAAFERAVRERTP